MSYFSFWQPEKNEEKNSNFSPEVAKVSQKCQPKGSSDELNLNSEVIYPQKKIVEARQRSSKVIAERRCVTDKRTDTEIC